MQPSNHDWWVESWKLLVVIPQTCQHKFLFKKWLELNSGENDVKCLTLHLIHKTWLTVASLYPNAGMSEAGRPPSRFSDLATSQPSATQDLFVLYKWTPWSNSGSDISYLARVCTVRTTTLGKARATWVKECFSWEELVSGGCPDKDFVSSTGKRLD